MNGLGLSGESHGIFWARRNLAAAVVAAIFVFIAMLAMASPARAANIVVTSNADSGAGTLRAAVATADGNTEADTITFDLPAGSRTITLASQISINAATPFGTTAYNTTVDGTGQSVTVSGGNRSRVFHVRGNLTVKRLTVSDGNRTTAVAGCCDTEGGGIYVQAPGNLAVIESTVSGNTAVRGGGIFSVARSDGTSPTTIENSTISGNTATSAGGGIFNGRGRTTITSSTITQNYASSLWGSGGGGAGVASAGDTSTETVVANSIISDNSSNCSEASACTFRHDGDVDFRSNSQTPHNSFTSQGYNIIGDSSRQFDPALGTGQAIDAFNKTGDQRGVTDPKLGPLQDNGGLSQTHALLTDSPAIDRGSTTLATDQRGLPRPIDFVGIVNASGGDGSDIGAFELEIAVNDAPVATDDTTDTDEDTALNYIAVLTNDTDANGDSLSVSSVGPASHGTVTDNNDGTINYTPNANYNGPDSFTYTVSDGKDGTDTATVNLTVNAVNDAPVAANDTKTTDEDTPLTFPSSDLVGNDDEGAPDESGQTLAVTEVFDGTHGTVDLGTDGNITFTPEANYHGDATFDYRVCDNGSPSECSIETAVVTVTVSPVNDAPEAVNDSATTDEDTAEDIDVIANDTDVDNTNAQLSVSSFTQPSNGAVTQNADGTLKYTPKADFNGTDSFTYKAKDASLDSNSAKVTITVRAVNDAPVAKDNTYTTDEDTPLTVEAPGLLGNDTDVENDTLRVADGNATTADGISPVSGPADGTVTLNANGSFTYTPGANFNGSDAFTYRVCDDGSPQKCSVETANVDVAINPINDAPVAKDDSLTTDEDTAGNGNVLTNDTDADNAILTAELVSGPSDGTLELNADGSYTYTPDANFNGSDSFTYKVNDGTVDSDTATVSLAVNAVNDAPTVTLASGGSCSTNTTSVSGTMNLSLADVDSSGVLALSATSLNQALVPAANVKFGGSGANRTVSITPAAKKSGSATITITASDGTAKSTTTIQVIVGTDKKETIKGTDGSDMIFGLNGDDTINAGNSNDLVCGGNGGGVINGGAGDDTLDGGNGNDTLRGDDGNDILRGGQGNDRLEGGNNDDTLTGGTGTDGFDGGTGADVATDHNAAEGDTRTNIP